MHRTQKRELEGIFWEDEAIMILLKKVNVVFVVFTFVFGLAVSSSYAAGGASHWGGSYGSYGSYMRVSKPRKRKRWNRRGDYVVYYPRRVVRVYPRYYPVYRTYPRYYVSDYYYPRRYYVPRRSAISLNFRF